MKHTHQVSIPFQIKYREGEIGSFGEVEKKQSKIGLQLTPIWSQLRFFGSVIYCKRLNQILYNNTRSKNAWLTDGQNFIYSNGKSAKSRSLLIFVLNFGIFTKPNNSGNSILTIKNHRSLYVVVRLC